PIRICILGPPAVGKSTVAAKICKHYKLYHITVQDAIAEKMTQLEEMVRMDDQEGESYDTSGAQELLETLRDNMNLNEDYVFSMDATDEFLKDRVRNLPESIVEGTHYTQDRFPHHLAVFRDRNSQDETVLDYFDELEIHPEHIEVTSEEDPEYLSVTKKIIRAVGPSKNYGPSEEERAEEEMRNAEERIRLLAAEKEERERKEAEEAAVRAARLEEWGKNLREVKRQEQEMLEVRALPLRNYLMKNVMPSLTEALVECCKVKPDDPVDYLAEYLLRSSAHVD
ncbi:hypothetical protein JZ751_010409, partial [Albula glossodonta]